MNYDDRPCLALRIFGFLWGTLLCLAAAVIVGSFIIGFFIFPFMLGYTYNRGPVWYMLLLSWSIVVWPAIKRIYTEGYEFFKCMVDIWILENI